MADQDDDSFFDGLPQSTLQDLEHHAVASTQQRVAALRSKQYNQVTKPYKLSRATSTTTTTTTANTWQDTVPSRPDASPQQHPHPPSSNYSYDGDEDVIDLDETVYIQPAPLPRLNAVNFHQNYLQSHPDHIDNQAIDNDNETQIALTHDARQQIQDPNEASERLMQLETRIRDLEREQAALQQSLQHAETAALKKNGEIAIVRAKHEKDIKEYERRIAIIQKLHADESAKHRSEAQAARRDRATIETNNRFLEHDLAQEVERRKRLKAANGTLPLRHKSIAQPEGGATGQSPSSTMAMPYRDGFDDHEIVLVSPSKPKDKAKAETPKAGEKRKRNVNPSPIRPLVFEESPARASPSLTVLVEQDDDERIRALDEQHHLRNMQQIINHRLPGARERTLEVLAKHSLPSLSETSIAGLLVDALTRYVPSRESMDLPIYICNHLLDLWGKCLHDHYYPPIHPLVDLFEFILAPGPRSTVSPLIERFVPLATKSIDIVAVPLARSSERSHPQKTKSEQDTESTLSEQINVDQILCIMHDMAMTASFSMDTNRTFWQKMEFDFTLMMLNVPQQLPHMQLILQMVGASVLPESFGVISPQPEKQSSLEMHTIDRLTNLLFEQPKAPSGEPPYEDVEMATLRIEAIRTLSAISVSKRGSIALAQHRTAVGRLVRFLHIQITSLYDLPPSYLEAEDDRLATGPSTIHTLTTALINLTIRLIYHLLQQHADLITLREKLEVIPGGHHKFLVSLTRLAFSEQMVYEAGIDEEAVDAAHEILDHILTPEEGDAVVEAIETPRGTNATRASAPG